MEANKDSRFSTFLKAFTSDWLARMSGPVSVPFTFLALYLTTWIRVLFGCLAAFCFILAAYRVWKNERAANLLLQDEIARLKAEGPKLCIYDNDDCRFFREVDSNDRNKVLGLYQQLNLTIENKGNRNAIVRRYDLSIRDFRSFEKLQPQTRTHILTRSTQFALRNDWILQGDTIISPANNVVRGILPFYIPDNPRANMQTIRCTLTLTDSNGNTTAHEFVLAEATS